MEERLRGDGRRVRAILKVIVLAKLLLWVLVVGEVEGHGGYGHAHGGSKFGGATYVVVEQRRCEERRASGVVALEEVSGGQKEDIPPLSIILASCTLLAVSPCLVPGPIVYSIFPLSDRGSHGFWT